MRSVRLCFALIVALAAPLFADANLHITDVGLHGYAGTPTAIRLVVKNPSSQAQSIHLRVTASTDFNDTSSVSSDLSLRGGEQRELELPLMLPGAKITAQAAVGSYIVGQGTYDKPLNSASNVVVIMCAAENICKATQSQIEFSGSVEDRADKNRQVAYLVMNDARDNWWAYPGNSTIVVAMPIAKLTQAQREALEGYLRRGGRLVLLEHEIEDPTFLAAYRNSPPPPNGEPVGRGVLFRIPSLSANTLGEVFRGRNLLGVIGRQVTAGWTPIGWDWLRRQFATKFNFPRLRWMLLWLAAYILIVGVVNFAVLRRLHRLELGWISMCVLALLFAAGFYFSSASRRPKHFGLDTLAAYYLDSRSPLAAADYSLRLSAPVRRTVTVSVDDPAVFTDSTVDRGEPNSQIWVEMNRQARLNREYDIRYGPPRQVALSLLKWSLRDLNLQGLHQFPGTVHFVAPNRLRNDTGLRFSQAVYLDYSTNSFYPLPPLASGDEIELGRITPKPIRTKDQQTPAWVPAPPQQSGTKLQELVTTSALPYVSEGQAFVGFSDAPALPVELNIPHQQNVHSVIFVNLEKP